MYSRKEVEAIFEKGKYKPSTVRNYSIGIISIAKRFDHVGVPKEPVSKWFTLEEFEKRYDDVKPLTRRNYISNVIALMKCTDDTKNELFEELSGQRDDYAGDYEKMVLSGKKTPEEEANWVEPEVIAEVYKSKIRPLMERMGFLKPRGKGMSAKDFDKEEVLKIGDFVILSVYLYPFSSIKDTTFGVIRNDLANLLYFSGKKLPADKKNYLHFPTALKGKLVMRDHKTEKRYGEITIDLPKELSTILHRWSQFRGLKDGDEVFEELKKSGITHILQSHMNKWTGKKLGTQMLRKIYISGRFGKQHQEEKAVANSMMHSVDMQQTVYSKKD